MFGSNLLDVAIGLVFIFLLVSLVCSAANEVLEGWLKNRSTDLERGIRELFGLDPKAKAPPMMVALYNNPMINGLFKGKYGEEATGAFQQVKDFLRKGPNLPSYIPARSFALALMDIATLPRSAASPPPGSPPAGTITAVSGASDATPQALQDNVKISLTAMPVAMPAPGQPGNPLTPLRQGVVQSLILPDQLKTALVTLIDAAGNDVAKARENIETWFNSGMERVSGWYKRRTQLIILLLGLGLSAVFNIDTITVAQQLAVNKSLRESMVAAAEQYAKANAESEVQTSAAKPSPSPAAIPAPTPLASPASSPAGANPTASPGVSPAATPSGSPAGAAGAGATGSQSSAQPVNQATAEEAFSQAYSKLEQLGLPIGWDTDEARTLVAHGVLMNKRAWVRKLLGLLITALAVSLGAPFWFDMLNKLIVVRSTVKPHERSPEEPAK